LALAAILGLLWLGFELAELVDVGVDWRAWEG
jgi:hypothetical protein